MRKPITKENVIFHKKRAIRKLNGLLETYISSEQPDILKKADLISYWLEEFTNYISFEDEFDPTRLLRYNRGNVLRINFGFNIGKELGGMHFAVVVDNDSKRNADVLTVIPLSSTDGRTVHSRSVDLGTELFSKISDVQKGLISSMEERLAAVDESVKVFQSTLELIKNVESSEKDSPAFKDKLKEVLNYKSQVETEKELLEKQFAQLERNEREIQKLKSGSMAVVNQITTVSKQRIYTPKRSEDFLYGISLSPAAMDKINEKIKELYIFD